MEKGPTLVRQCLAELVGTFLLVFFGTGAVHVAVSACTLLNDTRWFGRMKTLAVSSGIVATLAQILAHTPFRCTCPERCAS